MPSARAKIDVRSAAERRWAHEKNSTAAAVRDHDLHNAARSGKGRRRDDKRL